MGAIQRAPPPADWLIFMVKADLARIVHDTHGGFSHEEAAQLVDLLLDKIKSTLVSGETVKLAGFGSFRVGDAQTACWDIIPRRKPQFNWGRENK